MNLVLDIGNTSSRIYVFNGTQRMAKKIFKPGNLSMLQRVFSEFAIEGSILSSVAEPDKEIVEMLKLHSRYLDLTHKTPLPIKNLYKTSETLGTDRLACVVGAAHLHPGKDALVIDAGTCIKYDFVNAKGEYRGGNITPGFQMRLDALHHFTARLPQLKAKYMQEPMGTDTESSMLTGVYQGIVSEMEGFIALYEVESEMEEEDEELTVLLTGGDAAHFADELIFPIFAEPDLTGIGLNEILRYNRLEQ